MSMLICCALMLGGEAAPDLTGIWSVEAAHRDGGRVNLDAVCWCNGNGLVLLDKRTLLSCLFTHGLDVAQDPDHKTWVDFRVRDGNPPDPLGLKPKVPPFKGLWSVKDDTVVLYFPTDSESLRPLKIPETGEAGHLRIVLKRIGPYPEQALPKQDKK